AVVASASLFFWLDRAKVDSGGALFRDKPEREWVKNLKYSDDEQVKEWRGYGETGVQILMRGLERADRPGERAYRQVYRRTPRMFSRWLPDPKDDSTRATRMTLVSLLSSLGDDARSATPIMEDLLRHDEAASVREL